MTKVLASRGMGKTSRLLQLAMIDLEDGYNVIFILSSLSEVKRLKFLYGKIDFMTMEQFIEYKRGRGIDRSRTKIYIDELDYSLASILGTTNFTYSLTLEERI